MRLLVVTVLLLSSLFAQKLEVVQGAFDGKIVGFEQGHLLFESGFSGMLRIDPNQIVQTQSDKVMVLRTRGDIIMTGPVSLDSQGVRIDQVVVPYQDIYQMRPLSQQQKLHQEGFIDLSFHRISGSAKSATTTADAGWSGREAIHRHTLRAHLSRQKSDDQWIEDRQSYRYQYDRFMAVRWYLYGNLGYGTDRAADLDGRYEVGLGSGYQAVENDTTRVSISVGASRQSEQNRVAMDETDTVWQLGIGIHHKILSDRAQLFHESQSSFYPDDDTRITARTGVRAGLVGGLSASLQHRDERRRHTDEHDRALTVGLGYRW